MTPYYRRDRKLARQQRALVRLQDVELRSTDPLRPNQHINQPEVVAKAIAALKAKGVK